MIKLESEGINLLKIINTIKHLILKNVKRNQPKNEFVRQLGSIRSGIKTNPPLSPASTVAEIALTGLRLG